MNHVLTLLMTAGVALGTGGDENRQVVVEQALDQPTRLTIEDTSLAEVSRIIAEKTGVAITFGPEVLDLLPYGEATRVNVRLDNIRLREGLQAVCHQLAMDFRVTETGVEVVPSAALWRLGRRASWEEIGTVVQLMQTQWKAGGSDFEQIRQRVQFKLSPGGAGAGLDWDALAAQLRAAGAGRADELLTVAAEALGCTWYPSGDKIIVLPAIDQTLRQLARPVALRYTNRPFAEVLRGLARQSGLNVTVDPAAAAELAAGTKQNFTLLVEGATVEEALAQIGIATGLGYQVQPGGVVLCAATRAAESGGAAPATPPAAPAPATASPTRDPVVGKVVIPGKDGAYDIEFVIRESDLTEEERAMRIRIIDEARRRMREQQASAPETAPPAKP